MRIFFILSVLFFPICTQAQSFIGLTKEEAMEEIKSLPVTDVAESVVDGRVFIGLKNSRKDLVVCFLNKNNVINEQWMYINDYNRLGEVVKLMDSEHIRHSDLVWRNEESTLQYMINKQKDCFIIEVIRIH